MLQDNLASALLASGPLPLVMPPVTDIAHAPPGNCWDGGLIDYHLALPYSRIAGNPDGALLLYPHFNDDLVSGWLDKPFSWRRAGIGNNRGWLDNMRLISPSQAFMQMLSLGKLPSRNDFRIPNWHLAVSKGERMRDAFAAFIADPTAHLIESI